MKATVTKSELLAGISRAVGALPQRPTSMQVLHNILLDCSSNADAIRLEATDMEIASIAEIPATIRKAGRMTIPGKKLLESVRELPDGEVTLTGSDNHTLTLKSGRARLIIRGTAAEDYPTLPIFEGVQSRESAPLIPGSVPFVVEAAYLKETIRRTIVAASKDENRSFLTGASLVINGERSHFVATDGHRLAVNDFTIVSKQKKLEIDVIIPLRILTELAGNLPGEGSVEVQVGETQILFKFDGGAYYSRLIAEKYPDYQKIIPKALAKKIEVSRQDFIDTLKCVSPFSNPRTHALFLSIKSDKLVVTAETPEFGEGHDEVEAEVNGTPMDISFNSHYLLDGLKALTGDKLTFELGEKISPAVLTSGSDEGYKYILMPLRQ